MAVNIYLLNVHSDYNAGDLALSRVTIQQLQTNFPNCQITISMNDPQSYYGDLRVLSSHFIWVQKGHSWRWGRLAWLGPATLVPILTWRLFGKPWYGLTPQSLQDWLHAYLEADLVVSTAGGFFRSSGRGLALLLTSYSLLLALFAGKPLYIFPQSIGPFNNYWECPLARWIYSRARIVMAREPISVENLVACGFSRERILLLPDVAFGFVGASDVAAQEWLLSQGINPTNNRPLLAMTVMDWAATNPGFKRQTVYEEAVTAFIRMFVTQYGGKVLLLPQVWGPSREEDDRLTAQRLAKQFTDMSDSVIAFGESLPPEMLQAIFGEMDMVIGTRMHSNIFAASRGVPVIPIGYLHKTLGIARMAGLDGWVIDINEVDAETLIKKFEALWGQRDIVRAALKERIPILIQESQKAGQLTAKDYAGL